MSAMIEAAVLAHFRLFLRIAIYRLTSTHACEEKAGAHMIVITLTTEVSQEYLIL